MKPRFRILLIDDTEAVLEMVKSSVPDLITVSQFSIHIEIEILHVELTSIGEGEQRTYKISEKTINTLGMICRDKFDYIFSDFGYVGDKEWNKELRTKLLNTERRGVRKDDIQGHILQIKDIVIAFYKAVSESKIPPIQISWIKANFINHSGNVVLYTNSPQPFDNYFENVQSDIRIAEVKEAFMEASNIEFILMHKKGCIRSCRMIFSSSKRP